MKRKLLLSFFFLLALLTSSPLQAHVSREDLRNLSGSNIFLVYLEQGFSHIIPLGLDHILFILCLFLLSTELKTIIWQATAFTVAHSITLGLAMFNVLPEAPHLVEPVIALSIVFIAIENIITKKLQASRIIIVFAFGLIHGLGFAGVLKDIGLPANQYINALLSFNLGVELGQLSIILLAWITFGKWFRHKSWYRQRIVNPMSATIAVIAFYWTIQRAFFP